MILRRRKGFQNFLIKPFIQIDSQYSVKEFSCFCLWQQSICQVNGVFDQKRIFIRFDAIHFSMEILILQRTIHNKRNVVCNKTVDSLKVASVQKIRRLFENYQFLLQDWLLRCICNRKKCPFSYSKRNNRLFFFSLEDFFSLNMAFKRAKCLVQYCVVRVYLRPF